jgi:hypothetical protein
MLNKAAECCGALAWLPARSVQGSLDFWAPLFASRQKVEIHKLKRRIKLAISINQHE